MIKNSLIKGNSSIFISQMISPALTTHRNSAMLTRKNIKKDDPTIQAFVKYPAKSMIKKDGKKGYSLYAEYWVNSFPFDQSNGNEFDRSNGNLQIMWAQSVRNKTSFFFIHGIIHLFTTVSIQEVLFLNPVHLQENICNHHQETWKTLVYFILCPEAATEKCSQHLKGAASISS